MLLVVNVFGGTLNLPQPNLAARLLCRECWSFSWTVLQNICQQNMVVKVLLSVPWTLWRERGLFREKTCVKVAVRRGLIHKKQFSLWNTSSLLSTTVSTHWLSMMLELSHHTVNRSVLCHLKFTLSYWLYYLSIIIRKGSAWPVSCQNVERPECRSCHTASRMPTIYHCGRFPSSIFARSTFS